MTSPLYKYVMQAQLVTPPFQAVFWTVYNTPDTTGRNSGYFGQLQNITVSQQEQLAIPSNAVPTIDANAIQGIQISNAAPSDGQVLVYDAGGNVYVPGASGSGSQFDITLHNGLNSNVVTTGFSTVRIGGPTAAFSIDGLSTLPGPTPTTFVNTTAFPMTLVGTGSASAFPLNTQSKGAPLVLQPKTGSFTVVGDQTGTVCVVQNVGLHRPNIFNVQDYGAYGDGSHDDTAAFVDAVTAKDASSNGGEILVPQGIYKLTTAIDLGTKRFTLRGIGYHNTSTDVFGSVNWPTEVLGSVLHFTNVTDGLVVSAPNYLGSSIRDLGIIGPGSGTTTGINFSGTVPFVTIESVGVFNYGVAFNPGNQEDVAHTRLQITGCATGIKIDGSPTNLQFFNTYVQLCNDGILASTGELLKFYGGLIQGSLRGLNLSGGTEWAFDGVWFEGNGRNNAPTTITTTAANYTQPAQGSTVIVQMASTAGLLVNQGCHIVGGGDYAVSSLNVDGIHATLVNLYNGGNAAPTTVINSGAVVQFGAAYAGPDILFDISAHSVTNIGIKNCRLASDWNAITVVGSTGTVNDIQLEGCLIGQTLTIPARMFNVLISGCSTGAVVSNSTGPVTLINANDNGTVTSTAGGLQGFGLYDSVLGDFVPIIGGRLASQDNELGLGCTQSAKYTKFYNGTTAYLGVLRDSSNVHIDLLDTSAGGLFIVSGTAGKTFEVSFAGSGSSQFYTSPTIEFADATPVVRFRVTSAKLECNAPLAGHNTLSAPLDVSTSTPPTASGAEHVMSAAEYTCPNILVGTATLSGTGTILTFPNKRGIWLVDTSNITFGAQTLTLRAGTGAGNTVALTAVSNTLFWVQCKAANDLNPVTAP